MAAVVPGMLPPAVSSTPLRIPREDARAGAASCFTPADPAQQSLSLPNAALLCAFATLSALRPSSYADPLLPLV